MDEPESASSIIRSVLCDLGSQDILALADIDRRWDEIVGETLSERVRPLKISKDTLFLCTPSPVWSQEVLFSRELIKERVKEIVGVSIKDIRTTQTQGGNEPRKERTSVEAARGLSGAEPNGDALAMLQRARASYERSKAKKRRR